MIGKRHNGFTLLETMVVITIISILTLLTSNGVITLRENQYNLSINSNLETVYEYTSDTLKTGKYSRDITKLSSIAYALDKLSINNKSGTKFIDYTKDEIDYNTYINIIYKGIDTFEIDMPNLLVEDNIFIVYKGRTASIYYGERNTDSIKLYANVW